MIKNQSFLLFLIQYFCSLPLVLPISLFNNFSSLRNFIIQLTKLAKNKLPKNAITIKKIICKPNAPVVCSIILSHFLPVHFPAVAPIPLSTPEVLPSSWRSPRALSLSSPSLLPFPATVLVYICGTIGYN